MILKTLTILTIFSFCFFMSCGESKKEEPRDIPEGHEMHDHNGHQHNDTVTDSGEQDVSEVEIVEFTISESNREVQILIGTRNKPVKATIINLQDFLIGGSGNVTPDRAEKLLEQGQLIAAKIDKEIYIIFDAGGTIPTQLLKKYAGKNVGLIGKSQLIGDLKVFIADDIIPL